MLTSCDELLAGGLRLLQPVNGPRVNLDTVLLASWVKFRAGHSRFLEAGCAAGAVSLMLAVKFRNIHITGIEIQEELADLAKRNAENNNLADRVKFTAGDLRDKNLLPREYFDVVVINPPYESAKRGRVSPEPSRSAARHEISCTPDDVGEFASRVLKSKGRLFSVFTSERLDVFINAMTSHKLTPKRIRFVYSGENNNSGIFLLESIKDGGEGMIILPPLFVRDSDGNYTPEILKAYDFQEEQCTKY